MRYVPRSVRARPDGAQSFAEPHDGVPSWLVEPVVAWLRPVFRQRSRQGPYYFNTDLMRAMQTRMHLDRALDWSSANNAGNSLLQRLESDSDFTLDVLDYVLHYLSEVYPHGAEVQAAVLDEILRDGGSAWEVTPIEVGRAYALTRRTVGPIAEVVAEIRSGSERAADHLAQAWVHLMGRSPVPDQAYFHAVQAVEAAAKPVISPDDSQATLGKMISAVRMKPSKWSFALGESASSVLEPAELLWKTQRRHGTDELGAPLGMSQAEGDAAVHLALTLVRWFVSGAFKRAE